MVNKAATKKRRMLVREKKALMDTLLVYDQEKQKIYETQKRLWANGERLEKKRNEVCKQLADGIYNNKEDYKTPLYYKGKYFQLVADSFHSGVKTKYSVDIKDVKKL